MPASFMLALKMAGAGLLNCARFAWQGFSSPTGKETVKVCAIQSCFGLCCVDRADDVVVRHFCVQETFADQLQSFIRRGYANSHKGIREVRLFTGSHQLKPVPRAVFCVLGAGVSGSDARVRSAGAQGRGKRGRGCWGWCGRGSGLELSGPDGS